MQKTRQAVNLAVPSVPVAGRVRPKLLQKYIVVAKTTHRKDADLNFTCRAEENWLL